MLAVRLMLTEGLKNIIVIRSITQGQEHLYVLIHMSLSVTTTEHLNLKNTLKLVPGLPLETGIWFKWLQQHGGCFLFAGLKPGDGERSEHPRQWESGYLSFACLKPLYDLSCLADKVNTNIPFIPGSPSGINIRNYSSPLPKPLIISKERYRKKFYIYIWLID